MKTSVRWPDRARYWVDNTFSKGTIALVAWLGAISLGIIFIAAAVLAVTGLNQEGVNEALSFGEAAWQALMRTFDAGTMGGDTGWGFRWVMLFVTLGGIFVISSLIGVLSSAVDGKIEELRKGRSRVIENGHIVVLGWSEKVFTILSELVTANQNQKNPCIVVLAPKDKVEMEDSIRERVGNTGRTRIVCRTGTPIEMGDLMIAGVDTSRSIVVISPQSEDPDAEVIKTVLAITQRPGRRAEPYHIVAELTDPKNTEVTGVVGHGEVEWVLVGDLVARIIAQTCRQSGLSVVYTELLDFEGDEVYFTSPGEIAGKTYGESLAWFERNTVIGLAYAEGAVKLNPPMQELLRPEDMLIVIAADDDQIFCKPPSHRATVEFLNSADVHSEQPENTLILGWNWRGPTILRELDHYVAPGSRVLVVAMNEEIETMVQTAAVGLENQIVEVRRAETTDRTTLESLPLDKFDHAIVLSYLDNISAQQADSRTLITLLHLRDLANRKGLHFSITSEMLDVRNRALAEVTGANDFIVSGQLISLMLAQIAENKRLNPVFADLFDPEGSEIYLKPVESYIQLGTPVDFYTLLEAGRRRGETAIGYRLMAQAKDANQSYGVHLNPIKSEKIDLQPGDKLIILAEN